MKPARPHGPHLRPLAHCVHACYPVWYLGLTLIHTIHPHRWLATYLPLLSLYLAETAALKLVNFTEKIQTASGLSHLAWIVSSELDSWFDWCHPDDTEARLVLLAPGGPPCAARACA